MKQVFRATLLAFLLSLFAPSLAESSLLLWVKSDDGLAKKKVPCHNSCREAKRLSQAATAPLWGRWLCEPSNATPPFRAGARWRGRVIGRFVPVGNCGRRQWEMVRKIFERRLLVPPLAEAAP